MSQTLKPAHITLDESGAPFAPDFGDHYFSRKDGLAETRYVFLEGNQLPHAWQGKKRFVIAETGFGTGLNFLTTWKAWQQDPQACEYLHFISIEKHPIPRDTLLELLQTWDELDELKNQLCANYPVLISGIHTIKLGKVTLTLCFMDIADALLQLEASVDAWFLDGFAPARNESMWQVSIMQGIAKLSHQGTTLATFTAASMVRRNLQTAGFTVSKRKGFGKKREMLIATMEQAITANTTKPWFTPSKPKPKQDAIIIGAGIAGCQIAYALSQRGWNTTLIEQHARIATQASGNRAGVLIPKMTADANLGELFYQQAFIFALQQLKQLDQAFNIDWNACGAVQLNHNERESKRWQKLKERQLDRDFIQLIEAEDTQEITGLDLPYSASYFPQGGWLYPYSYCKALLEASQSQVHYQTKIQQLEYANGEWHVFDEAKQLIASSPHIILANSHRAIQLEQANFLPYQALLGQTTQTKSTTHSQQLKTTLGHEGYITPEVGNHHIFGATFERNQEQITLKPAADQQNMQQLQQYLPNLASNFKAYESSHAAIRMSTPDRFPYVGALPDKQAFQASYQDLKHGRKYQQYETASYQQGLYILTGLGSRGLTTSALCAEVLAAEMNQEPSPIQSQLREALHPARFLIKQLKQGKPL